MGVTLKMPIFEGRGDGNTTYLYYLGDECEDITGGYQFARMENTSVYSDQNVDFTLEGLRYELSYRTAKTVRCVNKISVTDYSLLGGVASVLKSCNNSMFGINCGQDGTYAGNNSEIAVAFANTSESISTRETRVRNANITSFTDKYLMLYSFWYAPSGSGYVFDSICRAIYLAKTDDISSLSEYGSTISALIANASALLNSESGVTAMLKCTGDFMWSALANSGFVSALNASPYKSKIQSNPQWGKAIALL